jgi:nucleotide-binding universal stress UspA family protein
MYTQPIIVGVDGSAESVRAAALACRIANAGGADVRLVHVVPPFILSSELGPVPVIAPELQEQLVKDSAAQVRSALMARGAVSSAAIDALVVRVGRAGQVLADEARESRAGLVVIGGKPHGAAARTFGGSTAHYLVRRLDVPLVVTGPVLRPVERVLVAVDLSPAASPALAMGRVLAKTLSARLRVVHVVEPVRFPVPIPLGIDDEAFHHRSVQAFEHIVGAIPELAPQDRVVRRGHLPEAVVAEVADWSADLLVVSSRGHGWMDRLFVGSTTERLLNLRPTTLVVVPAPTWRATRVAAKAPKSARARSRSQGKGQLV